LRQRHRASCAFLSLVAFVDRNLEGCFALHLADEHDELDTSGADRFDGELVFNRRRGSGRQGRIVPDPHFAAAWGYYALRGRIDRHAPPWERRTQRAFWRGSPTGEGLASDGPLEATPRVQLCLRSLERPDLLDARVGRVVECDPDHERELRAWGVVDTFVGPLEQLQYRYLISIDGNAGEWEGLWWKLYSGSVVLLVESAWDQWYGAWLEPWRHYVPVRSDLGDLCDSIQWCLENDAECEAIAHRARRFVAERADLAGAVAYTRAQLGGSSGVAVPP
jgi:hypothetical protein